MELSVFGKVNQKLTYDDCDENRNNEKKSETVLNSDEADKSDSNKLDDTIESKINENQTPCQVRTQMPLLSSLKRKNMTNDKSKSVRFDRVNVFLFERAQGYTCIPSDDINNSVTIGMSPRHVDKEVYDLDSYKKTKRLYHLDKLEEEKQKIYDDIKSIVLLHKEEQEEIKANSETTTTATTTIATTTTTTTTTTDKTNSKKIEEAKTYTDILNELSEIVDDDERLEKRVRELVQTHDCSDLIKEDDVKILEILDKREIYEDPNLDLPLNMDIFLPVLSPPERVQLLSKSGVHTIDETESTEIVEIRDSRQFCGCQCKGENACSDEKCSCFVNGIQCQLDKTRFPCGCSLKRCKNVNGTKRFDQRAVLKHYRNILFVNEMNTETQNLVIFEDLKQTIESNKTQKNKKKISKSNCSQNVEEVSSFPLSPKPKRVKHSS